MKLSVVAAAILLVNCGVQQTAKGNQDWERTKDCAAQAALEFKAGEAARGYDRGFTNHYDSQRQKCFMLTESTGSAVISKALSDAYERTIYGSFVSSVTLDKGLTDVHTVECYVLSSEGEKQICKSSDEFNALVDPYLGVSAKKATEKK